MGRPQCSTDCGGVTEWHGKSKAGVSWEVRRGNAVDVLYSLPEGRIDCAITSPPYYWQRNYGVIGQLGLERTIAEYVAGLVSVAQGIRRALRSDGLLFLNLGDTYYSAKGQPKGNDRKNKARRFELRAVDGPGLGVARKTSIGIPWRVALAMIDDGWILRSPIIW
jgi:hypothetical protein